MYEGIRGRIQGEKNEIRPAESAIKMEMFSKPGILY